MSEQPLDPTKPEAQRRSLPLKLKVAAAGGILATLAAVGHESAAGASTPEVPAPSDVTTSEAAHAPVTVSDPVTPNQGNGTETAVPRQTDPNVPGDPGHFDVVTTSPKLAPEHGDPVYVSPSKAPEHGDPVYVSPSHVSVVPKLKVSDTNLPKPENSVSVAATPATVEAPILPAAVVDTSSAPEVTIPAEQGSDGINGLALGAGIAAAAAGAGELVRRKVSGQ